MIDNTIHKYQLIHVVKGDEYIKDEWDILLVNPTTIVYSSYMRLCLSDRKKTIVELREMIDEYNYEVLAEMDYKKEVEKWFLNDESEDVKHD